MKTRHIAKYYIMLLLVMMSWTSSTDAPPAIGRALFVVAVLLPGMGNRHGLFLAAMTCFWTLSTYGYANSFMPVMSEVYVALVLVVIIFFKYKTHYTRFVRGGNYVVPLLLVLTCVRNLCEESLADNLVYILILVILMHYLLPIINKQTIDYFQMSFMVITIVLSSTFLYLSDNYTRPDEMGLIGWTDQNYFGMVIGMGASIGFSNCFRFKERPRSILIVSIAAISVAMTTMLLLASRGALLCLIVSVALLLVLSKGNKRLKFFIVVCVVAFLYYLFANDYFDMLTKRFAEEDGTGSQRTVIWSNKWNAFINRNSFLELLFGVGRQHGLAFGGTIRMPELGFHNDFLAFFISYGVVGLSLFIALLMQPLRDIRRHSPYRVVIIANVAYLLVGCLTLEPFYFGYFPFYAFLMYTMLLTRVKKCNNRIR